MTMDLKDFSHPSTSGGARWLHQGTLEPFQVGQGCLAKGGLELSPSEFLNFHLTLESCFANDSENFPMSGLCLVASRCFGAKLDKYHLTGQGIFKACDAGEHVLDSGL